VGENAMLMADIRIAVEKVIAKQRLDKAKLQRIIKK
jgi:hypothetical protein